MSNVLPDVSIDHLPLEINRQADGNLIPRIHVLRRHLLLILTESVKATKRNVGIGDVVLTRREKLEIITLLQDSAIVGRDIQATNGDASLAAGFRSTYQKKLTRVPRHIPCVPRASCSS